MHVALGRLGLLWICDLRVIFRNVFKSITKRDPVLLSALRMVSVWFVHSYDLRFYNSWLKKALDVIETQYFFGALTQ